MNRIRELRKKRKLTMKKLGNEIGMSESTISLYENEKRQPDKETLVLIANYFDVSLDYLLCREDEKPAVNDSGLDERIVNLLSDLSPDEVQRVRDFVSGLKAARKE